MISSKVKDSKEYYFEVNFFLILMPNTYVLTSLFYSAPMQGFAEKGSIHFSRKIFTNYFVVKKNVLRTTFALFF